MIREAPSALLEVAPELVDRRFELLQLHNEERNQRMLEGIARTGRQA
jgi:hypothetical protein